MQLPAASAAFLLRRRRQIRGVKRFQNLPQAPIIQMVLAPISFGCFHSHSRKSAARGSLPGLLSTRTSATIPTRYLRPFRAFPSTTAIRIAGPAHPTTESTLTSFFGGPILLLSTTSRWNGGQAYGLSQPRPHIDIRFDATIRCSGIRLRSRLKIGSAQKLSWRKGFSNVRSGCGDLVADIRIAFELHRRPSGSRRFSSTRRAGIGAAQRRPWCSSITDSCDR